VCHCPLSYVAELVVGDGAGVVRLSREELVVNVANVVRGAKVDRVSDAVNDFRDWDVVVVVVTVWDGADDVEEVDVVDDIEVGMIIVSCVAVTVATELVVDVGDAEYDTRGVAVVVVGSTSTMETVAMAPKVGVAVTTIVSVW
jgi:hypothetical protein